MPQVVESEVGFSLSPQQRRIWDLSRGEERSIVAFTAGPGVDRSRLEAAARQVVARNAVLCTAFRGSSELQYPLQSPGQARESAEISSIAEPDGRTRLTLSVPALCADRRTLQEVVRQIAATYDGHAPPAGELSYPQYAEWASAQLNDPDAADAIRFWKRQSAGALSAVQLPFIARDSEAARLSVHTRLEPGLVSRIEAIGRTTSVASVFMAAWYLLLSRLTGEKTLAIGEVVEGREHDVMKHALGVFARRVPLRLTLKESESVLEGLRALDRTRSEAREWSDAFDCAHAENLPFAFQYEDDQKRIAVSGGELVIESRSTGADGAMITLLVSRSEEGTAAELQFDAAAISREDADRMIRYLRNVLGSMTSGQGMMVGAVSVLDKEERAWLLENLNATVREPPRHAAFHEWFRETAAKKPDEIAAVSENETLTFAELERQSNQLAHYLQRAGVKPETRVGVLVDRSVQCLVAALAIWKAGGAYVPLDPLRTQSRLAFTLADAGIRLVLVHERLRGELAGQAVESIVIDAESPPWGHQPDSAPPTSVRGDCLAYVIYTSGSTGQPKGVMITHASLVNLTEALRLSIYAGSDARCVSLNAPLTFDASIKQIATLALGMTVDVIPEATRSDPARLLAYLHDHDIDVFDCTPFQFRKILEAGWNELEVRPRYVLLGGEGIDQALLRALQADTRTAFFNLYGPTECTVDAALCRVQPTHAEATIGGPLANMRTYILDDLLRPVPYGVVGELYVAGRGVARGYLGRPDLTASAFVADPFAGQGERMYRTGDRAAWQQDGTIRVRGRADRQLKIKGYRLEPGEIEEALRQHTDVRDAAVSIHEDRTGAARLVGYVVAGRRDALNLEGIRERLRATLPEYMVPAILLKIDSLPHSANGKLDYAALPDPGTPQAVSAPHAAPRTELEAQVAQLWQQVLGVERVGIRDNFFDLGGHSLLMARVHAGLKERFACDISMVEMFRHPTVELLSAWVAGERQSSEGRLSDARDRAAQRRQRRRS